MRKTREEFLIEENLSRSGATRERLIAFGSGRLRYLGFLLLEVAGSFHAADSPAWNNELFALKKSPLVLFGPMSPAMIGSVTHRTHIASMSN